MGNIVGTWMASWRKTAQLLRQSMRLCSLWQEHLKEVATANINPVWETLPSSMSSEDKREETSRAVSSISALVGETGEELVSMMTDLLATQHRKEEFSLVRDPEPDSLRFHKITNCIFSHLSFTLLEH